VAAAAIAVYDFNSDGHSNFRPWRRPDGLDDWGIGVIVGGSGTGKSTLLAEFGTPASPYWHEGLAVADHFYDSATAAERFTAVGLSSVPTWVKPYGVLSTGERFRADLARCLHDDAVIDEYTSVVDRNVAAAASRALSQYARRHGLRRIVLATCHRDVLPWIDPDWVVDTDGGAYAIKPRECLQRQPLVVDIYEVDRSMWAHFVGHHYLNGDLHPFARCYVATLRGTPVAFGAAIPFPHGSIRNAWRGHRIVTLPDFQGLGIGPRLADWIAEAHHRAGYAYYVKTTHPRLGQYRDNSSAWERIGRASSAAPVSFPARGAGAWVGSTRPAFSHRYVGGAA
jgi:GNAT superfamily N-acetyltransferase